ncbi:cadherin-5 [Carcharodon carcharias]|uniref:cadherin-5 n=1 Tax=Carcharodon carcharias TaxID=13397 RepID=UPI001B7E1B07|nr:cadherin-5 [Carcharodon carcharias]XP_041048031.1 cadherin-5 [Carcharodon carcharias]
MPRTMLFLMLVSYIVSCSAQPGRSMKGNSSDLQSDWIWNQLTCWESKSEPVQIGPINSMWHKKGVTKYELRGEGVGTIFKVDADNGNIGVYRPLDREKKARYNLEGLVIDIKTRKQMGPSTNFSVQVLDLNDNAPIFTKDPFNGTVPEMSDRGTSILTVSAHDPDDPTVGKHTNVTYKLLNNLENFFIEQETGLLRVKNPDLDRERKKDYHIIVQAKDMGLDPGGMSSTATVYISLTDINDNAPYFPHRQYNYSVSEAARIGATIGRVKAEDLDEGENAKILYTVVSPNSLFRIKTDPRTQEGLITIKEPLDFEKQRLHRLEVEAENPTLVKGRKYKTKTVLIFEVLDVDEPPLFSRDHYTFRVSENLPADTSVGTVLAKDPDQTKNKIGYSLRDGVNHFKIGKDNGIITTRMKLDREAIAWHNITVEAHEVGKSNSTSIAQVTIKVLDKNDNAPTLAENYNPHVCEDDVAGTVIQVISAVDLDETTPTVRFHFSIAVKDSNFSVKDNGNNTANITIKQAGFDQNEVSKFLVPIIISDNGHPSLSSNDTLEINVCSCDRERKPINCRHFAPLTSGVTVTVLLIVFLCIIIAIVLAVLIVHQKMQKKNAFVGLVKPPGEIREQLVRYDEEGGGEMDTNSFDITVLNSLRTNGPRLAKAVNCPPVYAQVRKPNNDMGTVVKMKKDEADGDRDGLPYDTLHVYGYEGADSVADSLSTLDVSSIDSEQDYDFLNDWGPRFHMLAELYGSDPCREISDY